MKTDALVAAGAHVATHRLDSLVVGFARLPADSARVDARADLHV